MASFFSSSFVRRRRVSTATRRTASATSCGCEDSRTNARDCRYRPGRGFSSVSKALGLPSIAIEPAIAGDRDACRRCSNRQRRVSHRLLRRAQALAATRCTPCFQETRPDACRCAKERLAFTAAERRAARISINRQRAAAQKNHDHEGPWRRRPRRHRGERQEV